ncbi:MAG: leucine-rich repeat protein, partial [Oligosphaeraceae bacterium]|nr:leucine-rich repeat protein [Oligosphaeraceae bacterium]
MKLFENYRGLLFLSCIFLLFASFGWAEGDYTSEDAFVFEDYIIGGTDGVIITAYIGEDATVNVPPTLGGKQVIAIGEGNKYDATAMGGGGGWEAKAFCNSAAESITFPEGLLQIQDAALANWNLTEVHLPASLVSMVGNPFVGRWDNARLEALTVAAGNAVFSLNQQGMLMQDAGTGNASLRFWLQNSMADFISEEGVLTFPAAAGIKKIGPTAVINDWSSTAEVKTLVFPPGLIAIAEAAFAKCNFLESAILPEGLLSLGGAAFRCPITLPASLTTLGGNPAIGHVINIAAGNDSFHYDENNFLLNADATTVYAWRQTDEQMVVPLVLPNTLVAIADFAFTQCNIEVGVLNLPPALTFLGKGAFAYCNGLMGLSVPGGVEVVPERCFATQDYQPLLQTIILAEGVKRLEKDSFLMFGGTSILLPASLEYCDPQAFNGIPQWNVSHPLQEYHVAPGNAHLQAVEGVLYSADGTTLIHCPESKSTLEEIPDGVTTIGPYAFENSQLTGYLVFPASVNTIHVSAFMPLAWNDPLLQVIYMLAGPPDLLPSGNAMQLTQPKLIFSSTFDAQWLPLLENGFYGPFPTEQLNAVPAFVKIARQDGVTGEMAAFFSGNLDLELTAESSDLTDLQLHYLLFAELEEAWGEPIPATEDDFVANGGEMTIDATVRIKVAPYRNGELCGPVVNARYINTQTFNAALDNDVLVFSTSIAKPWSVKNNFADPFGEYTSCLQADASVVNGSPSWLKTTVTGPGCLIFWCRGEGNNSYDYWKWFTVSDNSELIYSREGNRNFFWTKFRWQVGAGQHTITWNSERPYDNTGSGTFYLDAVAWYPDENLSFVLETVEDPFPFAVVKEYIGSSVDAVLPEKNIDDAPVMSLDRYAFSSATWLRSVNFSTLRHFDYLNYLWDCALLTDILYAGGPPNCLQNTRYPVLCYYPHNYDADNNLEPTNNQSWAYFLNSGAIGTRVFLPIDYPVSDRVLISRSAGEPESGRDGFSGSVTLSLTAPAGTALRYTTDGTYPTADSLSEPILTLTKSTTVHARAFRQVGGEWLPCSMVSSRTLVDLADLNPATGTTQEEITFTIDGETDMPWRPVLAATASGAQGLVAKAGPLRSGQQATLSGTFTLTESGIFSYRQYSRYDYWFSCRLYNAAGVDVTPTISKSTIGYNNWYRYTTGELAAGTYQVVWQVWVPASESREAQDYYHSLLLADFGVGALPTTLTVLCDPPAGGSVSANGVTGTTFNQYIGQNVVLKVTENDDYLLQGWSDGYTAYDLHERFVQIADPEIDGADANTYTAYFDEAARFFLACDPYNAGTLTYPGGGGASWREIKQLLGAQVNIGAYSKAGWRFDYWSDDDDDPETDPLPSNRTLTVTADLRGQTLTAFFQAGFSVTSRVFYPNINNPGWWLQGGGTVDGNGFYDSASDTEEVEVTLTATPDANFAFLGWDDNGNRVIDDGESTNPVRVLRLTRGELAEKGYDFAADALFQQTAPVVIDYDEGSEGLGEITISKDGEPLSLDDFRGDGCRLPVGTVLTVTATASENCRFKGWWRGWYQYDNPNVITVSAGNNTYHAVFVQLYPVQVVLADGSPGGCSARVLVGGVDQGLNSWQEANAFLTLEAVCAQHYRARWEGDIDSNTIYRNVSATPAENIFQVAFIPTYTVNLASSPDPCPGANLSFATQTFDLGTASNFSAYGNNYWRFLHWNDGVTDNNRTLEPAESGTYSFTAFFERYVRITCQAESTNFYNNCGDSTFEGAGDIAVTDVPKEVMITAVPGKGFRFDCWTDAAADALPDKTNPVRVFNISAADTLIPLKANFIKTQQVTVGVKPGTEAWGAITEGARDNVPVDYGAEISFTATPNPNCQFIRWSDYVTEPNRTITVEYDYVYLAEFASEAAINVHIQAGQEGWGCQAGVVGSDNNLTASGNFAVGVWHKLEARPAENHRFVRWSDNNYHRTRHIRLTDQGFEVTAIFAQTANLTLEFQTSPDPLPDGIEIPYWRCWLRYPATGYGFYYGPGTHVVDVGTCTLSYYAYGNWTVPATEEITLTVGENKTLTKTFELITTGTVTGYLNPSEISGKWRVKDTEEWCDSSSTLTLEQGDYEIEFQPVAGWLTPANQTITVKANRHISFTGVYSAIVPGVELTFSPSEVSEAAGPSATIATLRRVALEGNPIDLSKSLTIYLTVSERNALILPSSSIIIPAGRSLTQFPVGVIDNAIQEDFLYDDKNNVIGRGRIVTLSGRVAMAASCNCNGLPINDGIEQALEADLIIWDNDSPALSVTVAPSTLPERVEPYPQV